jgi:hypothetical protein
VDENLRTLERFFSQFSSLPFDDAAAERYGVIRAQLRKLGTPVGANDMMVASIALAEDATLATRNQDDWLASIKKNFPNDWHDLEKETEIIRLVQDSNGDGVLDWVIRDRETDHLPQDAKFSIAGGVLREDGGDTGSDLLDSRPRMDYPNHTELFWSARSLSNNDFEAPTVGQIYTQWGWVGAQTWINVDYDLVNAHWAAVFAMIYRRAADQVVMVVNQIDDAPGSTNLIYRIMYVQTGLPLEDFVDIKLHFYIPESMVGISVNSVDKGKAAYELKYEAASKDDRMFVMFTPQGSAEWKSIGVQVAAP